MQTDTAPVLLRTRCERCRGWVELECKGYSGYLDYPSYNEYICPHCHKQNHQRSSGTVLAARILTDPDA